MSIERPFVPGLTALLSLAACSAPPDGDLDLELETSSEPVIGNNLYVDCASKTGGGTNAQAIIDNATRIGRRIARSSAFAQCMSEGARVGVPREFTGGCSTGVIGPYLECDASSSPEGAWDDPLLGQSDARQIARLLSSTLTHHDVQHDCTNARVVGASTGAGAQAGSRASRDFDLPDLIEWGNVSLNLLSTAAIHWHETSHSQGYSHPETGTNAAACSYQPGEYCSGDNGGANIVGYCLREVAEKSAARCGATACATDEIAVIKDYDQSSSSQACQCVPDVFGWPTSENETSDSFGSALAVGDFDDDGYDDLAAGAPGENTGAGSLYVMRGSATGLQYWKRLRQSGMRFDNHGVSPAILNASLVETAIDNFGYALAAGNLNGDRYDDLAIGIPGKNSGAGAVVVLYGSATGLQAARVEYLDQRSHGGGVEAGDRFGAALALGDLDADGVGDLAVGAPFELYSGVASAGVVSAYKGAAGHLSTFGSFIGGTQAQELGFAIAIGNVDSDTRAELIIGSPARNSGAGIVTVHERLSSGWNTQVSLSRTSTARFGEALATGEVHSNTNREIIVGAPAESSNSGAVYLFSAAGAFLRRIVDDGEANDRFGASLAVGRVNFDARDDLVVGETGESFTGVNVTEGRIMVYFGAATGLGTPRSRSQGDVFGVSADDSALRTEARDNATFGRAVAVGSFTDIGPDFVDVVVGAPRDRPEPSVASGALFVYAPDTLMFARKIDQRTMRYGAILPVFTP